MNNSGAFGLFVEDSEEELDCVNYRNERRFIRERYNVLNLPNKKLVRYIIVLY